MQNIASRHRFARVAAGFVLLMPLPLLAATATTAPISGLWDASIHVNAIDVPFQFGIAVKGEQVSGWFFNGDEKIVSSGGSFKEGHLLLPFASYGKQIDAHLTGDGKLEGVYTPTTPGSPVKPVAFHAQPARAALADKQAVHASISGQWILPTGNSEKSGEQAWRLVIRQNGAQVSAAILRVDGDTGALTGRWQDGKLLLSHFDGARPALVEVRPGDNGTLQLTVHNSNGTDVPLTAYRPSQASAKGLPDAADPATHTSVQNPAEPLRFSFPDLDGKVVSNSDARFRGKVVLLDISGSWCPNCHDEAPFLQEMYRRYHARGLEIVTLNFEDSDAQIAHPARLQAFIRDFGIQYIVLQAGLTSQLQEKLPQAVNLDAYPTTFFIGRDGLVKGAHAGFAARATGDYYTELKKSFAAKVEQLLDEKPPVKAASAATPAPDLRAARR